MAQEEAGQALHAMHGIIAPFPFLPLSFVSFALNLHKTFRGLSTIHPSLSSTSIIATVPLLVLLYYLGRDGKEGRHA
jgi:hypothetical protein